MCSRRRDHNSGEDPPVVTLEEALREKYPKGILTAINKIYAEDILEEEVSNFSITFKIWRKKLTFTIPIRRSPKNY